jgi:hypothetical protein
MLRTGLQTLRQAIGALVHVRAESSATPTREEVGSSIKVEQKVQEVILKSIHTGLIAGSFGEMLKTFIKAELASGFSRLNAAGANELAKLKSDFAFGFTQSSTYVKADRSTATELGELMGGMLPGLAEFGGAGIVRHAISELKASGGEHGWLELGLGAVALVPGAMAATSLGKQAVVALRGGESLLREGATVDHLVSGEANIASRESTQIANELPKNGLFARVMSKNRASLFLNAGGEFGGKIDPELAKSITFKNGEAFVASYDEVAELKTPHDMAQRLTLTRDKAGQVLRTDADTVVVFQSKKQIPAATPVNPRLRGYGNTGSGRTAGNAREWVIENDTRVGLEAKGLKIQSVYTVDEFGRKFTWHSVVRDEKTFWEPSKVPSPINKLNLSNKMRSTDSSISDQKTILVKDSHQSNVKTSIVAQPVDSFGPTNGLDQVDNPILRSTEKSLLKTPSGAIPTPSSSRALIKNAALVGVAGALGASSVANASAMPIDAVKTEQPSKLQSLTPSQKLTSQQPVGLQEKANNLSVFAAKTEATVETKARGKVDLKNEADVNVATKLDAQQKTTFVAAVKSVATSIRTWFSKLFQAVANWFTPSKKIATPSIEDQQLQKPLSPAFPGLQHVGIGLYQVEPEKSFTHAGTKWEAGSVLQLRDDGDMQVVYGISREDHFNGLRRADDQLMPIITVRNDNGETSRFVAFEQMTPGVQFKVSHPTVLNAALTVYAGRFSIDEDGMPAMQVGSLYKYNGATFAVARSELGEVLNLSVNSLDLTSQTFTASVASMKIADTGKASTMLISQAKGQLQGHFGAQGISLSGEVKAVFKTAAMSGAGTVKVNDAGQLEVSGQLRGTRVADQEIPMLSSLVSNTGNAGSSSGTVTEPRNNFVTLTRQSGHVYASGEHVLAKGQLSTFGLGTTFKLKGFALKLGGTEFSQANASMPFAISKAGLWLPSGAETRQSTSDGGLKVIKWAYSKQTREVEIPEKAKTQAQNWNPKAGDFPTIALATIVTDGHKHVVSAVSPTGLSLQFVKDTVDPDKVHTVSADLQDMTIRLSEGEYQTLASENHIDNFTAQTYVASQMVGVDVLHTLVGLGKTQLMGFESILPASGGAHETLNSYVKRLDAYEGNLERQKAELSTASMGAGLGTALALGGVGFVGNLIETPNLLFGLSSNDTYANNSFKVKAQIKMKEMGMGVVNVAAIVSMFSGVPTFAAAAEMLNTGKIGLAVTGTMVGMAVPQAIDVAASDDTADRKLANYLFISVPLALQGGAKMNIEMKRAALVEDVRTILTERKLSADGIDVRVGADNKLALHFSSEAQLPKMHTLDRVILKLVEDGHTFKVTAEGVAAEKMALSPRYSKRMGEEFFSELKQAQKDASVNTEHQLAENQRALTRGKKLENKISAQVENLESKIDLLNRRLSNGEYLAEVQENLDARNAKGTSTQRDIGIPQSNSGANESIEQTGRRIQSDGSADHARASNLEGTREITRRISQFRSEAARLQSEKFSIVDSNRKYEQTIEGNKVRLEQIDQNLLFLENQIRRATPLKNGVEFSPKLDAKVDVTTFIQGLLKDGFDRGFTYAPVTSREGLATLVKNNPDKTYFVRVMNLSSYEKYGTYGPAKPFMETFLASDVVTKSGTRLFDLHLKDTLETTGYPNLVIDKALSGDKNYVVKVFEADPNKISALKGTWENVAAIAQTDRHLGFEFKKAGFSRTMNDLFAEVQSAPMPDLSYEGKQFRQFLNEHYNLNELYDGKTAVTVSETGQAGLPEYLLVPTDSLGKIKQWGESEFRPLGGVIKYADPATANHSVTPSMLTPVALPSRSYLDRLSLFGMGLGLLATQGAGSSSNQDNR